MRLDTAATSTHQYRQTNVAYNGIHIMLSDTTGSKMKLATIVFAKGLQTHIICIQGYIHTQIQ